MTQLSLEKEISKTQEFASNLPSIMEDCYTEDDSQLFSISKFFIFSIFKSVGIES